MCTTMAIGKKATLDGSVIIAHSDDDVSDERVIFVPSYITQKTRPVYYDNAALGPEKDPKTGKAYNASELYRYIGSSRGPGYILNPLPEGLYESIPVGNIQFPITAGTLSIKEGQKTYAYFDSSYGVMNEKGLMIGECTCGAKVHPEPSDKRLFYSAELSRMALEYCETARQAIDLIGFLIKTYGYHGTGETLLLGDSDEAWVIEMCGYSMEGADGIWVAQRVPDNGYFVAANQFRIREVHKNRPDEIKYPDNLFDVCRELGWWNPETDSELDWAATVTYGEYSHPYYSLRRVWRALTKAKPSSNLPAWVENGYTKAYPFTVIPDVKLDIAKVADIYRDHYEGTEFDMTQGKGAGPWNDPTRYENNPDKGNTFELSVNVPQGAWERPVSIYRCGMFWINQANAAHKGKPRNGVSWIGLDRPESNCLIPFFCQVSKLPELVETMNLVDFDYKNSLWWIFNFTANFATLKYCYMLPEIQELRDKLENAEYDEVKKIQNGENENSIEDLTRYCRENTDRIHTEWMNLAKKLIVTFNDGCRTTEKEPMQKIDYPQWWLSEAGYYQGPISYNKAECKGHQ